LTGHLVLSTLHTNSAAESIARLLEMGMDPFNFSDSLLAVLAQRLVRRLCPSCKRRELARPEEVEQMALEYQRSAHEDVSAASTEALLARWRHAHGDAQGQLWLHRKVGCKACDDRGYKGRMGIHELLVSNDDIRHLIRHRGSAAEILSKALSAHMLTIRQDGIEKVWQGLTDLSEVLAASNT
jgi:type II secretory ATPase GspE/PulE/Tfp pilus assembly ATPase PilB-like protein